MANRRIMGVIIACIILILSGMGEAGSLDKYRSILAGKCYTFKCYPNIYNNLNNSVSSLDGMRISFGMPDNSYTSSKTIAEEEKLTAEAQARGDKGDYVRMIDVIVMDGENRYTEMLGNCKLISNGEVFTYRHFYFNGQENYQGGHRSKRGYVHMDEIAPNENYWASSNFGKNLESPEDIADVGNPLLMKMLAVIYPVSTANVELPAYSFAASGQDKDGCLYEDYTGTQGSRQHVVRCYFRNGELIKMAYASYPQDSNRSKDDVEKYSIEIKEFSPVPERQYFSLPQALKVVRS